MKLTSMNSSMLMTVTAWHRWPTQVFVFLRTVVVTVRTCLPLVGPVRT